MNRLFPSDLPEKLIQNAERLKLDFWKGDGGIVASYELHGTSGNLDENADVAQSADMQFVTDLIAQFRKGGE